MRADRHVLRLLAAMVATIVVGLLPSLALAHTGHHHAAHVHADRPGAVQQVSQGAPRATHAVAVAHGPAAMDAGHALSAALASADTEAGHDGQPCCPACTGHCCVAGCGATGLPGAATDLPLPSARRAALSHPGVRLASGLPPGVLPEPPRSCG